MTTRIEKDSMGPLEVPVDAYYGVQTQRAVTNFPISGWPLPPRLIHAMGRIKRAAGVTMRTPLAASRVTVGGIRRGTIHGASNRVYTALSRVF